MYKLIAKLLIMINQYQFQAKINNLLDTPTAFSLHTAYSRVPIQLLIIVLAEKIANL